MRVTDKLLDVIESTVFVDADREFVAAGLALLSLAISRLAPEEREATLQALEDGALRREVEARLTSKHVKSMFRKWRRPPPPDCPTPNSVPTSVMRTLQQEQLSADQFNARLQELLTAYKLNGG